MQVPCLGEAGDIPHPHVGQRGPHATCRWEPPEIRQRVTNWIRPGVRQMRQTPIVSGVTLLPLALGIGANAAVFPAGVSR